MTPGQLLKIALLLNMDGPETVQHLMDPNSYPPLEDLRLKAIVEARNIENRMGSIPAIPENFETHIGLNLTLVKLHEIADSI